MKFGVALKSILLVGGLTSSIAVTQGPDLSDPAEQPKFTTEVPNALDPGFIFSPDESGKLTIKMGPATHYTGLVASDGETPLPTPIWGYGNGEHITWPGKTIEAHRGSPVYVKWVNKFKGLPYVLTGKDNSALGFGDYSGESVIDSSLHWAYSLPDCRYCGLNGTFQCDGLDAIVDHGTPTVTHLHGHASSPESDGNPGTSEKAGVSLLRKCILIFSFPVRYRAVLCQRML